MGIIIDSLPFDLVDRTVLTICGAIVMLAVTAGINRLNRVILLGSKRLFKVRLGCDERAYVDEWFESWWSDAIEAALAEGTGHMAALGVLCRLATLPTAVMSVRKGARLAGTPRAIATTTLCGEDLRGNDRPNWDGVLITADYGMFLRSLATVIYGEPPVAYRHDGRTQVSDADIVWHGVSDDGLPIEMIGEIKRYRPSE